MSLRDQHSPEVIEDEIAQTRARIEQRFDVLSHDISPGNLISRALGTEHRDLPDAMGAAFQIARSNPLAASLALAGLAGLAIGRARRSPDAVGSEKRGQPVSTDRDPARRVGESAAALKGRATAMLDRATSAVDSVQEAAGRFVNQVSDGASATAEAVTAAAAIARHGAAKVSDTTSKTLGHIEAAAEAASDHLNKVPVRARAGTEHAVAWIRENPLPAGFIAIAVGAIAASAATVRRAEPTRSRVTAGRELFEAAHMQEPTKARSTPVATPDIADAGTADRLAEQRAASGSNNDRFSSPGAAAPGAARVTR